MGRIDRCRTGILALALVFMMASSALAEDDPGKRAEAAATRAEQAAVRSEAAASRVDEAVSRLERVLERLEREQATRRPRAAAKK
jgi:hypothetical protein